jgi:hypothetical protein
MDDMDLKGPPAAAAAVPRAVDVRLPQFWLSKPAAWFTLAESRFCIRHIKDEQQQFDHLLSSLGDNVLADILDAIDEAGQSAQPYTELKARLLETHVLSDFERLEILFKMEPLGGRKPSQLLNAMIQYCPDGKEKDIFFHFLFMQRLPLALRAMLGDAQPGDPRALAARADRLLALNPLPASPIAVVEDASDGTVAAVNSQRGGSRGRGGKSRGAGGARGGGRGGKANPSPAHLARNSSGLCFYHWTFGEKATKCEALCTWQGN